MKSFSINDILDLKDQNFENDKSKDIPSTDKNSTAIASNRTHAAQLNFWQKVSIKVEIDPTSGTPYAIVSVITPSSISLSSVHKKIKDKINTRTNSLLKGKILISMNSLDFRIDLIDNSITKEEFEDELYSLRIHKQPNAKIHKRTLLSSLNMFTDLNTSAENPQEMVLSATDSSSTDDANSTVKSSGVRYAAQVKFWETVAIDVKVNENSNLPYAIVSIIPPNSTSIKEVFKKVSDKIQTRYDSPLKDKVSIVMINSSLFFISLIDYSMTKDEFENAVISLKKRQSVPKIINRRMSFASSCQTPEDISALGKRSATTENSVQLNSIPIENMKRRKIGLEESPIVNRDTEETSAKQNIPETFEATEQVDKQSITTDSKTKQFGVEDWRRASISMKMDANTNRVYATVTTNPPDLDMLKRLCHKMKNKIRERKNSPLKGKVSIHFPNQDELFAQYGNYYFLIELKDNSITPGEFEIAVDHLLFNGNNKLRNVNLYQSKVRNEQTRDETNSGPNFTFPSDRVNTEKELNLIPPVHEQSPENANMDEYDYLNIFSIFNQPSAPEIRDSELLIADTYDYYFGPF